MKPPITTTTAFIKDPYKSIVSLLIEFNDTEGLEQRDFRKILEINGKTEIFNTIQ